MREYGGSKNVFWRQREGLCESWLAVQTGNLSHFWQGQCAESALIIYEESFYSEIKAVQEQTTMRLRNIDLGLTRVIDMDVYS